MYLKLVEAGRKNPDVTQFVLIMDFAGLNLIQHGCPLCKLLCFMWSEALHVARINSISNQNNKK